MSNKFEKRLKRMEESHEYTVSGITLVIGEWLAEHHDLHLHDDELEELLKTALDQASVDGFELVKLPDKAGDCMLDTEEWRGGWNGCLNSVEILEIKHDS